MPSPSATDGAPPHSLASFLDSAATVPPPPTSPPHPPPPARPSLPRRTFHRRPLPAGVVDLASRPGAAALARALTAGTAASFLPLCGVASTQPHPALCGLTSLATALNALGVDPGRVWAGPWRWVTEELLDCCVSTETVRERGVGLDALACTARCNGAVVTVGRAPSADELRAVVLRVMRDGGGGGGNGEAADAPSSATPPLGLSPSRPPTPPPPPSPLAAGSAVASEVLVAAYNRRTLGQTGSGHFSPLGAYDASTDSVLVLEVARFKYPPHWVPVPDLAAAMAPVDPDTGAPRGYLLLRRQGGVVGGEGSAADGTTGRTTCRGRVPPTTVTLSCSAGGCARLDAAIRAVRRLPLPSPPVAAAMAQGVAGAAAAAGGAAAALVSAVASAGVFGGGGVPPLVVPLSGRGCGAGRRGGGVCAATPAALGTPAIPSASATSGDGDGCCGNGDAAAPGACPACVGGGATAAAAAEAGVRLAASARQLPLWAAAVPEVIRSGSGSHEGSGGVEEIVILAAVLTVAAVAQLASEGGVGELAADGRAGLEGVENLADDPALAAEVAALASLLTKLATDGGSKSREGGGSEGAAACKCVVPTAEKN